MTRLVIRLVVNAAALYAAAWSLQGIHFQGSFWSLLGVSLVFGVVNALIRPVALLLSFPALIVTLGLFTLVVNAVMLWLTSSLSGTLGLGFTVDGFWPALVGAVIVSVVSAVLSFVLPDGKRREE
jgi:putative membrane protein